MITIKVENNLKEILTFLEDQGYRWSTGNNPTDGIGWKSNIITIKDKSLTHSTGNVIPSDAITFEEFKRYFIMERKQIQAGDTVILTNNSVFTVIEVPTGKYLMPKGSLRAMVKLEEICEEDLSPKPGTSSIREIKNFQGSLLWTKPVEMTIAEIEKALKLTSGTLRIKK